MRILFVLEHFHPYIGGAENLFWELGRSLVLQGHSVGVVTTRFRNDLPVKEIVSGITIYRVSCYNRFFFSFLSLRQILKVLPDYEIIQTTSYNAALPAWIAGLLHKKPVVITFHEVWGRLWWKLPFISLPLRVGFFLWEQMVLRLPYAKVVAVSDATRQSLIKSGLRPDNVELIYNGLDYSEFEGLDWEPPTQFTYTYFGRLGTSKGLELLMPAASKFALTHPDSRFKLIIPKYPVAIYNWVKAKIKQWHMEDHVILLHDLSRKALFSEVRTSSCVVIPSHSEGFCFVAAEVVALQVPIISSQRTALKEVAGGKLIEIGDLDENGVYKGLVEAYNQQWEEITPIQFALSASVAQYVRLFQSL